MSVRLMAAKVWDSPMRASNVGWSLVGAALDGAESDDGSDRDSRD
jgi:hypothetical protein